MKTAILSIIAIIYVLPVLGQKTHHNTNDVYNSKELIFYGYDFSHFKLAEAKRLNDEKIKVAIPQWIDFVNQRKNEGTLQKMFKKEKVKFDFDYTLNIIKTINETELASIIKNTISADSIQTIINNYPIKEKEGIGFVIIVECFEKNKERSTAYFTFFDLATKKVLLSDYFGSNDADGYGLANHWGVGLNTLFTKYSADIYRKNLKKSNKNQTSN